MNIHVYKLMNGETIIANFLRREIINERTGETAFIVKTPYEMHVSGTEVHLGHFGWLSHIIDHYPDREYPIPTNAVMLVVEDGEDDPVAEPLKCLYLQTLEMNEGIT